MILDVALGVMLGLVLFGLLLWALPALILAAGCLAVAGALIALLWCLGWEWTAVIGACIGSVWVYQRQEDARVRRRRAALGYDEPQAKP